jgi:hypothetical protein
LNAESTKTEDSLRTGTWGLLVRWKTLYNMQVNHFIHDRSQFYY